MICFSTSNQKMNFFTEFFVFHTSSQISKNFLHVSENNWFMSKLFELIKALVNYSNQLTDFYMMGTSVLNGWKIISGPSKSKLTENMSYIINQVSPSEDDHSCCRVKISRHLKPAWNAETTYLFFGWDVLAIDLVPKPCHFDTVFICVLLFSSGPELILFKFFDWFIVLIEKI